MRIACLCDKVGPISILLSELPIERYRDEWVISTKKKHVFMKPTPEH